MKTQLREAFEALVADKPCAPWVATRLRHLLDRSDAGDVRAAHYATGRDQEWGALRPGYKGTWRTR